MWAAATQQPAGALHMAQVFNTDAHRTATAAHLQTSSGALTCEPTCKMQHKPAGGMHTLIAMCAKACQQATDMPNTAVLLTLCVRRRCLPLLQVCQDAQLPSHVACPTNPSINAKQHRCRQISLGALDHHSMQLSSPQQPPCTEGALPAVGTHHCGSCCGHCCCCCGHSCCLMC
jgi:hypothetical protein